MWNKITLDLDCHAPVTHNVPMLLVKYATAPVFMQRLVTSKPEMMVQTSPANGVLHLNNKKGSGRVIATEPNVLLCHHDAMFVDENSTSTVV